MLTTERPWTATTAEAIAPTGYGLRLHGGTEDERIISIPPGKHSIGSGPRCSLRLQYAGVQPLECLIVRDEAGLRVRRWSDNTRLNGVPFDEANLASGDVLSLGPVDLEIVTPQTEELLFVEPEEQFIAAEELLAELEEPLAEVVETAAIETVDAALARVDEVEANLPSADLPNIVEIEPQILQPTVTSSAWDTAETAETAVNQTATADATAGDEVTGEQQHATPIARRRRHRVRAALRRQRIEYDELVTRVNDLERKVEQALAEPMQVVPDHVEAAHEPSQLTQLTQQSQPIQPTEIRREPVPKINLLETELGDIREQLTAREEELGQALYSIDVLERQLIDSQHTMHAFADERVDWEKQFTELESRLAQYVERIQELERQLNQVRTVKAEETSPTPTVTTDWASESSSSEPVADAFVDAEFAPKVERNSWGTRSGESATWEAVVDESASTETGQIAVETATETIEPRRAASDAPVENVEDVDAALERLRGLSIWREAPAAVAEERESGSSQATVDETREPPGPEPDSFIERYAHLLPADDATPASPVAAPPTPTVVAAEPAAEHEEESVEQYMAKLMERMRGSATSSPESSAPAVKPAAQFNAADEDDSGPACAWPNPQLFTNLEDIKSKVIAPELASDMVAMRALANQSARHALGVHAARTFRSSARTRFIVALLGASAGLYLLLDAPEWKSLQFAAGCVATIAALYWGGLTLGALIKGTRVGAFENVDDDDDRDPVQSLRPPLPIDVERRPGE